MENIHTVAKYQYGYEKKSDTIFEVCDMPCHLYFQWLLQFLLIFIFHKSPKIIKYVCILVLVAKKILYE